MMQDSGNSGQDLAPGSNRPDGPFVQRGVVAGSPGSSSTGGGLCCSEMGL